MFYKIAMSTALSTLLPLIHIPRCPEPLRYQALRNACRQFCRETEWWRAELASFNTVVGTAGYALTNPTAKTLFLRIYELKRDDLPLNERYWSFDGTTLTFDPTPTKVAAIAASVVFVPTILCDEVADSLVTRFGEVIAAGAIFNLKSDKGSEVDPTPWFDPGGAAIARQVFQDGIGTARLEVYSSRQSGDKQVDLMGGIW